MQVVCRTPLSTHAPLRGLLPAGRGRSNTALHKKQTTPFAGSPVNDHLHIQEHSLAVRASPAQDCRQQLTPPTTYIHDSLAAAPIVRILHITPHTTAAHQKSDRQWGGRPDPQQRAADTYACACSCSLPCKHGLTHDGKQHSRIDEAGSFW
jgi:hypothetical protein